MSVQDKTGTSRRGQALTGAVAGVAVIAVLVAVYVGIQVSDGDDKTPAAAAAPAASAPAAGPTEPAPAPSQPAQDPAAQNPAAQTPPDPALLKQPVVKAGGSGRVTKLTVTEIIAGKGPKLVAGQTIMANYVGVTYKDGKEFDSSWKTGQPAQFPVGAGQLIEGWDKGLVGVKVGSRVQLDIPAVQAYGENPEGGRPPGDLRFVIDVLAAQ